MLAEMTPEEFREWWAADSLDPLDDSWRQAGEICATINNVTARWNSTNVLPQEEMRTADDYIPRLEFIKQPVREVPREELTAAASAKRYGPTR